MHMCFCVLLYFTACMLYYCNTVGWAWWDWGLIWWLTILLQCYDTVGWVTWPVKYRPRMTYTVSSGTLNPTQINSISEFHTPCNISKRLKSVAGLCQILCACRLWQMLAFGRLTVFERGVARVTWSILEFYTPLNVSGMSEDRFVKFCALVGPIAEVLVLWWQIVSQVGVVKVTWRLKFLANKC